VDDKLHSKVREEFRMGIYWLGVQDDIGKEEALWA